LKRPYLVLQFLQRERLLGIFPSLRKRSRVISRRFQTYSCRTGLVDEAVVRYMYGVQSWTRGALLSLKKRVEALVYVVSW